MRACCLFDHRPNCMPEQKNSDLRFSRLERRSVSVYAFRLNKVACRPAHLIHVLTTARRASHLALSLTKVDPSFISKP